MLRTLFYIVGIYFIYKFIFEFLVPLFRATTKVQHDLRTMQQKMEEQMNAQQNRNTSGNREDAVAPKPPQHEYIDFEEVKK